MDRRRSRHSGRQQGHLPVFPNELRQARKKLPGDMGELLQEADDERQRGFQLGAGRTARCERIDGWVEFTNGADEGGAAMLGWRFFVEAAERCYHGRVPDEVHIVEAAERRHYGRVVLQAVGLVGQFQQAVSSVVYAGWAQL